MDLKEIKKIAAFARRAGVKKIAMDGLEIEFKDEIIIQRPRVKKLEAVPKDPSIPAAPPLPTLDDINRYIYDQTEDAG